MAIVQISQIKHRRGLKADLPNSLEEGEIGLTLDTGEVFIGTPNLPVATERSNAGIFPYGNTQILTEWTENVSKFLEYSYLYRSTTINTSSQSIIYGNPKASPIAGWLLNDGLSTEKMFISRTLQERLDDSVSIKSYGAQGNCSYDLVNIPKNNQLSLETYAIRRAALDVSNVTNNKSSLNDWHPRALHFPAGVYAVNDSLFLPPNSTWIGDGKGKTIITLVSSVSNKTEWKNRTLLFTVDGGLLPEDFDNSGPGTAIDNHSYGNMDLTFVNTKSLPNNIIVRGITFRIDINQAGDNRFPYDVVRLIRASNVTFYDCEFIGNWRSTGEIKSSINTVNDDSFYYQGSLTELGDSLAVLIDSNEGMSSDYKPKNITFLNCDFSNTTYTTILTDDVRHISFINSSFNGHHRGIVLNEPKNLDTKLTYGLSNVNGVGSGYIKVSNSYFSNIQKEAIITHPNGNLVSAQSSYSTEYFGGGIISSFNRFENVGNGNTNAGSLDLVNLPTITPKTPIIHFVDNSNFNISLGDSFSRSSISEKTGELIGINEFPRIKFNPLDQNLVINSQDFTRTNYRKIQLINKPLLNQNPPALVFSHTNATVIEINYIIVSQANPASTPKRRTGTIKIVTDSQMSGIAGFEDEYTESGAGIDLTFDTFVNGNELKLHYRNNEGYVITMYYNYDYLSALL